MGFKLVNAFFREILPVSLDARITGNVKHSVSMEYSGYKIDDDMR